MNALRIARNACEFVQALGQAAVLQPPARDAGWLAGSQLQGGYWLRFCCRRSPLSRVRLRRRSLVGVTSMSSSAATYLLWCGEGVDTLVSRCGGDSGSWVGGASCQV